MRAKKHFYIEESEVISGPFGSTLKSESYLAKGDVPFVRIENIRGGFNIDTSNLVYISAADNLKLLNSQLFVDDIILSKVGKIGVCARVDSQIKTCNISENNIGIKLKNFFPEEKHFILTYLNSKFGQILISRRQSGNVQQKLNVGDICQIPIPKFNCGFYEMISSLILESETCIKSSNEIYFAAEKILAKKIQIDNFMADAKNIAVKSFSQSFLKSGRLDAEYYQTKYDDLQNFLDNLPTAKLANVVTIFKSIEPGSDFYSDEGVPFIRVSDVNKFGISEPDKKLSLKVDKNLYPCKDTILFSKDGSVGIAYKVRENLTAVTSGALLHLKLKTAEILPDYLTLYLNSKLVQMLAERDTNGAIIQHWKISDIEKIPVPIIDAETQGKIAALVEKSFNLRAESERLLEVAKLAVEMAIERGEDVAIKYLRGEKIGD